MSIAAKSGDKLLEYSKISESRSVLLVEDDPLLRKTCRSFLEEMGFQVHEAESGEDALILLLGQRVFDLLLIDINLGKGINGIELIESVRQNHSSQVLIMSALPKDDRSEFFIEKPFTMKGLETIIRSMFNPDT
ncbi:MAG: response regulator [Sphingobium sp.]